MVLYVLNSLCLRRYEVNYSISDVMSCKEEHLPQLVVSLYVVYYLDMCLDIGYIALGSIWMKNNPIFHPVCINLNGVLPLLALSSFIGVLFWVLIILFKCGTYFWNVVFIDKSLGFVDYFSSSWAFAHKELMRKGSFNWILQRGKSKGNMRWSFQRKLGLVFCGGRWWWWWHNGVVDGEVEGKRDSFGWIRPLGYFGDRTSYYENLLYSNQSLFESFSKVTPHP